VGAFFGCSQNAPQHRTIVSSALNTTDAYITLQESELRIHHVLSAAVEQIPALRPQTVVWSPENDYIAWSEKTDSGSRIVVMDTTTRKQEVPYESRQLVTRIVFSPQAESIAFMENNALFAMTIHGEQIRRIAEEVTEYAWSPKGRSLFVSTAEKTQLITPSTVSLDRLIIDDVTDYPLQGIAFRRADLVVGFMVDGEKGLQLVAVNPQNQKVDVLTNWSSGVDEFTLPVAITSWVSPDASALAVEELHNSGRYQFSEYTFVTNQRSAPIAGARMVGWVQPHVPLLLQDFHLMARQGILQGDTQLSIPIDSPQVVVRSYTSP